MRGAHDREAGRPRAWDVHLFLAQRASAVVLAVAAAVHLATIIYAVRGGVTAGEILGRTRGSAGFAGFYTLFVAAVAVHAPIGLRNIFREWTRWRGASLDVAMLGVGLVLLAMGLRAVAAVYLA